MLVAALGFALEAASRSLLPSIPLFALALVFATAGGGALFSPGDRRLTQIGALGGGLGALFALLAMPFLGVSAGLLLLAVSLFGGWGAGRMALELEPATPGVPSPRATPSLAAKVAVDELILGFEYALGTMGYRLDGTIERVVRDVDDMHRFLDGADLLARPAAYHEVPPPLVDPEITIRSVRGRRVEVLRFESGYAPPAGAAGRARWGAIDACRDAFAYVLRHEGEPRPWIIATNGYRMGHAAIDVGIFDRFHDETRGLGANVLIPVLPLHGPRSPHRHSGTGFLGIDVVCTIHAESQALWDMRRLRSWIAAQGEPPVGAFGLSLGGFTTANFASLVDDLAAAVPGIPLADVRRVLERHGAGPQLDYAKHLGLDLDRVGEILRVVSPLALEPAVPHDGRMLFGATADRLVTPDQVRDLWRHWQEPEIVWYEGAHVSFMGEREVWQAVDRTFHKAGIAAA